MLCYVMLTRDFVEWGISYVRSRRGKTIEKLHDWKREQNLMKFSRWRPDVDNNDIC